MHVKTHIYTQDKLLGNSNCKLEKNKLKKYEIAKLLILMLECVKL